jgi:putative transposase
MKKWLRAMPSPATIQQLQALLDEYREYYNNRRHSALPRRMSPAQAWATAPTLGGPNSLPRQVDATLHRCLVSQTGQISVGTNRMSIGRALAATTLTAIRDGARITVYDKDGNPIGHAILDPAKNYVPFTMIDPTFRATLDRRSQPRV